MTRPQTCQRPGCQRRCWNPQRTACSPTCAAALRLHNEADRVIDTLGTNPYTQDFRDQVLLLCEQIDRALAARNEIKQAALSTGFTRQDWTALLRGDSHTAT